MKRSGFILIATAMFFSTDAAAWQAKVVPPTRKVVVKKGHQFPEYETATIEGCRNEWESFQIVIRPDSAVTGVNVVMSDMTDNDGNTIPSSAFRLYREWFLDIVNPSGWGMSVPNHLREAGLYPDPLIPFVDPYDDEHVPTGAPFDIGMEREGSGVVWVDLLIPSDATPGEYHGTAVVSASEREDIEIPVTVTVWELDMPDKRSIGTSYRMSDKEVRRYHGGPDSENTDENFDEILKNYYLAGQEHRMDPTGFDAPVSFDFDESGNLLEVDWTEYDAFMKPRINGSYFGTGIGVTRFDVGMFGPGQGHSLTDDEYKQASSALANHLNEKGWWEKAWVYSKDEPWLADIGEDPLPKMEEVANDARLLIEGNELWKGHILVTGFSFEQAVPHVGIWCPVHPMYDSWFWTEEDYPGRGDYNQHIADGGELWFYNCNGNVPPYAGYDIDTTHGYEPRILKWGSWWEGATGYLFWRQLYWKHFDPWVEWQAVDHFGPIFARNGDGILMFPGDSNGTFEEPQTPEFLSIDGPVVSFRMKQIRDGFEDWELFIMAEKAGLGDWARLETAKAYKRFGNYFEENCEIENYYCPDDEPWTLDESVLLEVRRTVAAKILHALYPDRYTDPDEPVEPEIVEQAHVVENSDITVTADTITPSDTATAQETTDTGSGNAETSGGGCSGTDSNNSSRDFPVGILILLAAAAVTVLASKKLVKAVG